MATANKTKRRNFFFVAKWILAKQMKKVKPIVSFSLRIEEFFLRGAKQSWIVQTNFFPLLRSVVSTREEKTFLKGGKAFFLPKPKWWSSSLDVHWTFEITIIKPLMIIDCWCCYWNTFSRFFSHRKIILSEKKIHFDNFFLKKKTFFFCSFWYHHQDSSW